jgi:DNA-binding NtrC family response regulator
LELSREPDTRAPGSAFSRRRPVRSTHFVAPAATRREGDRRLEAWNRTAVEAIKLGACHYLAKPSNSDDIEAAFGKALGDAEVSITARPTSLKTLEWERINETLIEADFNISETARRLGMHRRTLARKLHKRP